MYLGRIGSLSTQSRKQPGFPFASVMPYALDEHERPLHYTKRRQGGCRLGQIFCSQIARIFFSMAG
jgi:hypothetical protein